MKKNKNENIKHKISNKVLWVLTSLAFILCMFGVFHIPILSSFGVKIFPNRNPIWGIFVILIVIVCALPFVFCVQELLLRRREKRTGKK